MKTVAILILAMAGCLVLLAAEPASKAVKPVLMWDGETWDTVQIRVINDKDGKPVDGARVWLLTRGGDCLAYGAYRAAVAAKDQEKFIKENGAIEQFGSRVFTDADGKTAIWTPLRVGGSTMSDGTKRTHRSVRGIVIVEDWGYERFESDLEELLPSDFKPDDTSPISITIRLKKKAAKQR